MFIYETTELLPHAPPGQLYRLWRRGVLHAHFYNAQRRWLIAQGFTFFDMGTEVFECARSTISTYYEPELWPLVFENGDDTFPGPGADLVEEAENDAIYYYRAARDFAHEAKSWFLWWPTYRSGNDRFAAWFGYVVFNMVQQRAAYQHAEILRLTERGRPPKPGTL